MDDIARLIEDHVDGASRERMLEHLRVCKRCFAVYQDCVVERSVPDVEGLLDEPEDDLVEAGMKILESEQAAADTYTARPSRRWSVRAWRLAAAAVAVGFVLAGVYWSLLVRGERNPVLDAEILAPVEAAVGEVSKLGQFVLPGGEKYLNGSISVFRSSSVTLNEPLKSSLQYLFDTYQAGSELSDVAYWLVAGYVATEQIDAARRYLPDARERFPDDSRLVVMDAIIGCLDGQYDRSEKLLRSVLRAHPEDPTVLINLAFVLDEGGKAAEAQGILKQIQRLHPGTPFAKRAEAALARFQR